MWQCWLPLGAAGIWGAYSLKGNLAPGSAHRTARPQQPACRRTYGRAHDICRRRECLPWPRHLALIVGSSNVLSREKSTSRCSGNWDVTLQPVSPRPLVLPTPDPGPPEDRGRRGGSKLWGQTLKERLSSGPAGKAGGRRRGTGARASARTTVTPNFPPETPVPLDACHVVSLCLVSPSPGADHKGFPRSGAMAVVPSKACFPGGLWLTSGLGFPEGTHHANW